MTYTADEVNKAVNALEELDDTSYAFAGEYQYGVWRELKYGTPVDVKLQGERVTLTTVDDYGGEGKGDDLWVVFTAGTQLFRKSGYYASGYGYEWDGELEEVRAVEKTIIVYESI